MKILIYGSKGWIGNQFLNYLNNGNLLDFYKNGTLLSKHKKNILNNLEIIEGKVRLNNFDDLKKELELHVQDKITGEEVDWFSGYVNLKSQKEKF